MLKFLRKARLYVLAIPFLLFWLGAGLNQIAINANHDAMPVVYNAGNVEKFIDKEGGYPKESWGNEILTDERHSVLLPHARYKILCDWIDFKDVKYSIGDGFIGAAEDLRPYIGYVWGFVLLAALHEKKE